MLVVFFSGENVKTGSYYIKQITDKVENRFYVYLHRRVSDNKVFYVGKGNGRRAWSKSIRSDWWKSVEKKHGFKVEIVFDHLSESDAFQIEIDTILEFQYFGHPLTNLTKGGEGAVGYKYTGEKLERLQNHIRAQSAKQADPTVYTFYCLNGDSFTGTRVAFSKFSGISTSAITKLFQKVGTRNVVKNWSLRPIEFKLPEKKFKSSPQKRSHFDPNIYTFYHVLGDKFTGTRSEFGDYSQIALSKIASLFCKNPRRSLFGWSLKEISLEDYTHSKI